VKSFLRLLPLVSLALVSAVLAPAADQRTYTSSSFQVLIDGVPYDNVRSYSGGEFVADIVTEASSGSAAPKKHVANMRAKPLQVVFSPTDSAGLAALVNEALGNPSTRHTVTVVTATYGGQTKTATDYLNSTVTGLSTTAFDGAVKDLASLTLTFEPEQVRAATPPTTSPGLGSKTKTPLASNFRFSLDGLPSTRVATVAALSAQRASTTDSIGILREPTASVGKLTLANLVITVSAADLAPWQAWADSWMVQGHHLEADEKNASLTLLAPDMTTTVLPISFSHVGLVRLSPPTNSVNNSSVAKFEVELYFESASVSTGITSSSTTSSTNSGTPPSTPPATSPTASTPAATSPAATTDSTPGTSPNSDAATSQTSGTATSTSSNPNATSGASTSTGTTSTPATSTKDLTPATLNPARQPTASTTLTPRATELTPVAKSPLAAATTGTAAAATTPTAGGDPADQGARDPREFPRIEGLVRKSYTSFDREGTSEETVVYTAKAGIDDVLGRYESTMKSAGWEEARKNESGSANDLTHYYHLKWTKTVQEVDLRFTQTKSGGTELIIAVYSNRVGNLSALTAAMKDTATEAVAAEGSPNDMGARDPADFPRIARSTRKSYSASGNATSPDETAVYRAKVAIKSVEAFFVNQLSQSDWEQVDRRESGDPLGGTHDTTLRWTRGKRAVKIYLREIEPAITEITVWLSSSG